MPALVPELVNMASDPAVSTGELLRRTLVAARRLDVPELVGWTSAELNGYHDCEIPDYRIIRGQIMVMNPVRGLIPFRVLNAEAFDFLSRHLEIQSIPELEELVRSDGELGRYFPPEVEQRVMQGMQLSMRPQLYFSTAQVKGIVEKVRTRILEWALDLEGRGVLGEGMTFTQKEKQTVREQHYHFANVSGSQIQISSNGSTQTQATTITSPDLEALQGLIDALGTALGNGCVQSDVAGELWAELATLKAQAASPKPKWAIIKATARTIKTVADGAAGNILGELAKPHVQTLLALAAGVVGG